MCEIHPKLPKSTYALLFSVTPAHLGWDGECGARPCCRRCCCLFDIKAMSTLSCCDISNSNKRPSLALLSLPGNLCSPRKWGQTRAWTRPFAKLHLVEHALEGNEGPIICFEFYLLIWPRNRGARFSVCQCTQHFAYTNKH